MIDPFSTSLLLSFLSRNSSSRSSLFSLSPTRTRINNSQLVDSNFIRKVNSKNSYKEYQSAQIKEAQKIVEQADSDLNSFKSLVNELRDLIELAQDSEIQGEDRTLIQTQAQELIEELDSLAKASNYNSTRLFDGSFKARDLGSGLRVSFENISSSRLGGLSIIEVDQDIIRSPLIGTAQVLTINGYNVPATTDDKTSNVKGTYSAISYANAINSISEKTGVTASATSTVRNLELNLGGTGFKGDVVGTNLRLNGVTTTGAVYSAQDFIDLVNNVSQDSGVRAELGSGDSVNLIADDGRNIQLRVSSSGSDFYKLFNTTANRTGWFLGDSVFTISNGFSVDTAGGIELTSSAEIRLSNQSSKFIAKNPGTYGIVSKTSLSNIDLSTADTADRALQILDATVEDLEASQTRIDVIHSRLDLRSASLANQLSNIESFTKKFESDREILRLTDRTSQQVLTAKRQASSLYKSLNTYRLGALLQGIFDRTNY